MNRSMPMNAGRRPTWIGTAWMGMALALLALPVAANQVYQWKDAKGVTHYSDSPPVNQPHKTRELSLKPASTTAAPKPVVNSDCSNARANLKLLQGTGPVSIDENKDGKPDRELTADERSKRTRLAESQIETYCGDTAAPTTTPGNPAK